MKSRRGFRHRGWRMFAAVRSSGGMKPREGTSAGRLAKAAEPQRKPPNREQGPEAGETGDMSESTAPETNGRRACGAERRGRPRRLETLRRE